jgi:hypothetical protein
MNSSVQDKLLSIEVTPPSGAWDKIAAELDDADIEHSYPKRLYDLTDTPPAHVWGVITTALDRSPVAEKLLAMEVTPPTGVWNKIKTSLDGEYEAAVPERRRLAPVFRYAAAAAIAGLLFFSGYQLFNKKSQPEETTAKTITPINTNDNLPTPSTEKNDNAIAIDTKEQKDGPIIKADETIEHARDMAALEASKKTYARLDMPKQNKRLKEVADFYFTEPVFNPPATRKIDINETMPLDVNETEVMKENDPNRYISLLTKDGKVIRISKKLSDLACCVSGDDLDKDCQDQMKKWRDKIANSGNHSPASFLDILTLINSLKDDNQ